MDSIIRICQLALKQKLVSYYRDIDRKKEKRRGRKKGSKRKIERKKKGEAERKGVKER